MPKRILICADGTWNTPEQTDRGQPAPTNVERLASAVLPEDAHGMTQVVLYHHGVGTRGGFLDRIVGGALGVGISRNIEEVYCFLANNYAPGDELYFLGFSRGAYTARSLVGLIRNSGILRRQHLRRYREAYDLYRERGDSSHPRSERARAFRADYAWPDMRFRFVGVWDTVGALGIPETPLRIVLNRRNEFHDVSLSTWVDHAHHALAIDERRKPFLPAIWTKQKDAPAHQVLEQAWFPGVHSNVGGGYVDTGLSDGALSWLWDRAERAGLALDPQLRARPNPAGELRDSMTWYYRLLGDGTRRLGATNPIGDEALHCSALLRAKQVAAYAPEPLTHFLNAKPAPRVLEP